MSNNVILGEVVEELHYQIPLADKPRFESDVKKNGMVVLPFEGVLVSYFEDNEANTSQLIHYECVCPDGKIIAVGGSTINFGTNRRSRNMARLEGLKANISGKYLFRISVNEGGKNDIIGEVPLFINIDFNQEIKK